MTPLSDSYAALLLDYATGALDPASRLVVDTYFEMRPAARADGWLAESAGGALLDLLAPAPLRAGAARPVWRPWAVWGSALQETRSAIRAAAAAEDDGRGWRWRMPGYRVRPLAIPGASLIRLSRTRLRKRQAGLRDDLTLILRGACEAGEMRYDPGEIIIAGEEPEFAPRVVGPDACVCLRAREAAGSRRARGRVRDEAGRWP